MGTISIDVITVVRNDPEGLERTIKSVAEQTHDNVNQIVIDGASTDTQTPRILKLYSDHFSHCISEPDKGIYDAMNKGLPLARENSFIVFLNAGDVFSQKDALSTAVEQIDDSVDAFYGDFHVRDSDGSMVRHKARVFDLPTLKHFGTGVACHQAFFVRKVIAPPYNIKYTIKAELDWYFEIWEQNPSLKVKHIESPMVIFDKGGVGYQRFIRNRIQWLQVVYSRFGWRTIAEYDLVLYLLKNAKYRYTWIEKIPFQLQLFQMINLGVRLSAKFLTKSKQ